MNDSAAAPLVTSEALRLGIPRLAASCAGHRLHPACSCTTRQSPSFRSRTPGGSRHPRWRWTNYWPVHELDEPSDLTLFQMHMEPHSDFHMAVSSMLHAFQCLSVPFSASQGHLAAASKRKRQSQIAECLSCTRRVSDRPHGGLPWLPVQWRADPCRWRQHVEAAEPHMAR